MSQTRKYPQIFIVKKINNNNRNGEQKATHRSYGGNYEWLQEIIDNDDIDENILLKTMYELPSQENVEEVIIDSGAAKGQSQPIIVHSKGNKSKSEKTTAA